MKKITLPFHSTLFAAAIILLFAAVLFSGCIDSAEPRKIPAVIGEVEVYDSIAGSANPSVGDDNVMLYFGLNSTRDGYVFNHRDVSSFRDGNVIHVSVNLTNFYPYFDQPGSGLIMSIGKKADFTDGEEYKLIINNGTNPIETVIFRYDGDFLMTSEMAPVEAIKIQQNGTQIEAVAEIREYYIFSQMIDEENITFRQSEDFKETSIYIPINDVNNTPTYLLHRFTKTYVIGDLNELQDGSYSVQINNKEEIFEIRDGILYRNHLAEVGFIKLEADEYGISVNYSAFVGEESDFLMDTVCVSINLDTDPIMNFSSYPTAELYIFENRLRSDSEQMPLRVEKSDSLSVAELWNRKMDDGEYRVIVNDQEATFKIENGKVVDIQNYTISEDKRQQIKIKDWVDVPTLDNESNESESVS